VPVLEHQKRRPLAVVRIRTIEASPMQSPAAEASPPGKPSSGHEPPRLLPRETAVDRFVPRRCHRSARPSQTQPGRNLSVPAPPASSTRLSYARSTLPRNMDASLVISILLGIAAVLVAIFVPISIEKSRRPIFSIEVGEEASGRRLARKLEVRPCSRGQCTARRQTRRLAVAGNGDGL